MAAAKKWAQEEGISVWEVDCQLDSELFLNEYPRWRADGPQHPCILQRMFAYTKELRLKEHEWTIHQGHQQPVPWEDAEAKTLAIQMVEFQTIWEEVKVYQQKRLLGPPPYGSEQMEALDREICASLKSRCGRGGVLPGQKKIRGEPPQTLLSPATRPNPITGPGEAMRTHTTKPSRKLERHTKKH